MTGVPVGLSTASVFPENAVTAFRLAAEAGYDGIEVLVSAEPVTQQARALQRLSRDFAIPVLAVHSPCLLVTSTVWGTDPIGKLTRSVAMAEEVGASTVVVHPPFVHQRRAAAAFADAVAGAGERSGVRIAVENMFPVRVRGREVNTYRPHWDASLGDYRELTLDLSHTATAGADARRMAARMGPRLVHVHLTDGSGSPRDEHLVPGRGTQPCAEVLAGLSANFAGTVVVEISTRSVDAAQRAVDLAESLAFARRHLPGPGARPEPPRP